MRGFGINQQEFARQLSISQGSFPNAGDSATMDRLGQISRKNLQNEPKKFFGISISMESYGFERFGFRTN
jgi:hypothetical protein